MQTVCEYCRSILVRHDLDLTRVGEVSDLPPDSSPIQLGTEGVYRTWSFVVVGRILYEYEDGRWNEWHLGFQNGSSGWLSDAQCEFALSLQRPAPGPLPAADGVSPGQQFNFENVVYRVTTITQALYAGVEGDLPFEYWDKTVCSFADLGTTDAKFGTIDFSEAPPLLYLGEFVSFDDLHLKNLRQFEGWS
ncbi:MAG: DUF4178 domain-containing protein [Acidobacteria bacterium]|nr:DUF4178 domain-containing protein [Acidobacteriota bacterium]